VCNEFFGRVSAIKPSLIELLESFHYPADEIGRIQSQWEKLHLVEWPKNLNINEFWITILNYKNASKENPFDD
jgi:hypothetical protein